MFSLFLCVLLRNISLQPIEMVSGPKSSRGGLCAYLYAAKGGVPREILLVALYYRAMFSWYGDFSLIPDFECIQFSKRANLPKSNQFPFFSVPVFVHPPPAPQKVPVLQEPSVTKSNQIVWEMCARAKKKQAAHTASEHWKLMTGDGRKQRNLRKMKDMGGGGGGGRR